MRGTVGETLERLILLQIGAAAATRDRVQEIVDSLVEQGRVEREEGRTVVNDVMNRARERSTGARSLVDASLQQGLRRGGLPTRESTISCTRSRVAAAAPICNRIKRSSVSPTVPRITTSRSSCAPPT